MNKLLIILLWVLLFTACADVDSAMLFGGPDEGYNFDNSDLPEEYFIDESLVEIFTLTSNDDGNKAEIYAAYIGDQNRIDIDTVIMYCHGNAPTLDLFWPKVAQMANLGGKHNHGIMMYDYRGYGKSQGTSTGLGTMMADLEVCMAWLKGKGLEDERLILLGESLGSIPAGHWVGENQIINTKKLIMEVPQSSANAIGQDASGLSLPSSFLTDFNFDIVGNVAKYQGELLWMHGTLDETAPIGNAREIYKVHQGTYKDSVIIEGAPHNLRGYMGEKEWGAAVLGFVQR